MAIDRGDLIKYLRQSSLFFDLSDTDIDRILPYFIEEEIGENSLIYSQGQESGSLYLLYSGKIDLVKVGVQKPVSTLLPGDVFGYEALKLWQRRMTSARAVEAVKVLRIGMADLHNLIRLMPVLYSRLQIRVDSFRVRLGVRFSWLDAGETVYFVSRIHPIFLVRALILPGVLLMLDFSVWLWAFSRAPSTAISVPFGILFVIFAIWFLWNYLDWTNDYSVITNQRAVFQEKIIGIYNNRREAFLTAIRSVDLKTTLWGNYLGYSDVIVHTYAGVVTLQRLQNAKEAMQFLEEQRRRMITAQSRRDKEDFQVYLRRRVHPTQSSAQPAPASSPAALQKPIITPRTPFPYRMRFEEGTKVTYRTHIVFLFAKVWWAVLIMLLIPILSLYNVFAMPGTFASPALWRVLIFPIILIYLVLGGIYWYRSEDWHNDTYAISETQIIDRTKKPLGREETRTASMGNIEAIRFEQKGILALIFNYGTVFLRVGQTELTFDNVFNPSDVQRDIYRRIVEREQKQQQERNTQERERVMGWIESYSDMRDEDMDNPPTA
jgi:hypothetical protein